MIMSSKQLSPWLQPIEWTSPDCETNEALELTLTEAAQRLSVAPRTLRKLLDLEGICDREKRQGSPIMVTADLVKILEAKLHHSIPFSKIPGILGVGRHIAEDLRDQGEIPMWVHGGSKGLKHRYMFVRSDVGQWIAMLIPPVRTLSAVPRGCTTIAKAVRKHVPITAIVAGLRSNTIRVIAVLEGLSQFGGAIVSLADLNASRPAAVKQALGSRRSGPRGPYKTYTRRTIRKRRGSRPTSSEQVLDQEAE
jgi:hypothetical protein